MAALPSALPVVNSAKLSTLDDEAERLRHLIEKQPCCLLRVGLDGLLLAANDAALQQLGARDLGQALDRPFTGWLIPGHPERWHEFAARVRDHGSGSAECELVDLEGAQHAVLLQGVLLADHPDGIASVILVVRNISGTRRIEEVLQEHTSTRQALADAQQRLDRELAEQQGLLKAIDERDASNQRLLAERAKIQALAEEYHLALLLKERDGQRRLDRLQAELDEALAERQRLEASLAKRESTQQQLLAAQAVEGAQVERLQRERDEARAERLRLEASLSERESTRQLLLAAQAVQRERLDHLQRELDEARAERLPLEASLAEHESTRQLLAAHAAERERFHKALAEDHERVVAAEREGRQQMNALQSKLDGAVAEHLRLEDLLEEQESYRKALGARHTAERAEAERALAAARMEREQALKALADQRVELQSLDENTRSLEPLASAGRLALEVGHELRCRVAAVNASARSLLLRCEETSADRQQIEALLAEANRAASLVRQFVQGGTDPVENPIPQDVASGAVDQPCGSGRTS